MREVDFLGSKGVVFYAINMAVGISIAIPGFANDLAHGVLGQLPFGAISMVGVRCVQGSGPSVWWGAGGSRVRAISMVGCRCMQGSGWVVCGCMRAGKQSCWEMP